MLLKYRFWLRDTAIIAHWVTHQNRCIDQIDNTNETKGTVNHDWLANSNDTCVFYLLQVKYSFQILIIHWITHDRCKESWGEGAGASTRVCGNHRKRPIWRLACWLIVTARDDTTRTFLACLLSIWTAKQPEI